MSYVKFLLKLSCFLAPSLACAQPLKYCPAPADNPLRGLVPYAGQAGSNAFPHSMEFQYFPLAALMKDWETYDWQALDKLLNSVKSRGNQAVIRIYCEYPGNGNEIPKFLQDAGVKVVEWDTEKNQKGKVGTPDYRNPLMRRALCEFIAAMGNRYDGDPRLGFITAGFLGLWGEWHNYPRTELSAPKEVQEEVMDAFEKAFSSTKILLRYPADEASQDYASNADRPLGYHDDSFGWATLDTGKKDEEWFFMRGINAAGAEEKWKTHPIGGETRPELWETIFTGKPHEKEQDFLKCIVATHASWLMDSSMFSEKAMSDKIRLERALKETGRMGYELFVSEATINGTKLELKIENRGVAPFYYDWPVEVQADGDTPQQADWKISEIIPGTPVEWSMDLIKVPDSIKIRIPNPMAGGKSLRFANSENDGDWLLLK